MNKYKKGDIVVCVNLYDAEKDVDDVSDKDHLILGKEYEIIDTAYPDLDDYPISVICEQGNKYYYRESNFEMKNKFRMKTIENILK